MNSQFDTKIYHILHIDRLQSVINYQHLYSDKIVKASSLGGTTIGMNHIKDRRSTNEIQCHPGLMVGDCVPFYFCPRSVMLYMIKMANSSQLGYKGGQNQIIHLEADLRKTVSWAIASSKRWAFTLSNAGSFYFESRKDLANLAEIDWNAVNALHWPGLMEKKQAEFLVEDMFPWSLVDRVGIRHDPTFGQAVGNILSQSPHRPLFHYTPDWYYE